MKLADKSLISVVIPAFNEAQNIPEILAELRDILAREWAGDFEIIVIDDHSSDGTFAAVVGSPGPQARCLRLSRRSGSHLALRSGLAQARGCAVLCLSADGQDDPNVFRQMIAKWRSGAHVVWALRQDRNDEPWLIRLTADMFYFILSLVSRDQVQSVDLARADFYLLDRIVVDAINSCPEIHTSLFGLINWMGFAHDSVPYVRRGRRHGHSKWDYCRRFRLAFDWIIGFSVVPFHLAAWLGLCSACAGLLFATWIACGAFGGHPIQGWSSLLVCLLVLGGCQLIVVGILGEYLWRNLDESRRRPLYFIEKKSFD